MLLGIVGNLLLVKIELSNMKITKLLFIIMLMKMILIMKLLFLLLILLKYFLDILFLKILKLLDIMVFIERSLNNIRILIN